MTHTEESAEIDTWLGALRSDYEPAPPAARERMGARLAQAGLTAVAVGSAVAVAQAAPRGFFYSKAFAVLATLPVGIVVGAAGHAWLAPPAIVTAAPSALPAVAAARVLPEPVPPSVVDPLPPLEQINPQPVTPKVRASSSAAAPEKQGLEHQLQLLEQARTQLSEGQPAATLELLRQHRAQYPQSALEQEREALSVRALMVAGRHAEAKKRAAAFVQRYPSSVLRGSVERAVGSIP